MDPQSSESIQPAPDSKAQLSGGSIAPPPVSSEDQEPANLRDWLRQNGPSLLVVAAVIILVLKIGGPGYLARGAGVMFGLGIVIFLHELGHFAVAKWCDVHVETFSIGFGPALPGCWYKYGETTYKLAMIPIGGYVKMVGETPEDGEDEKNPRSFKNKTVPQRMAIISAGVIMNLILGCICFVLVYMIPGVERSPAVIGTVEAGSPAWKLGAESGDVISQIGDVHNPYFDDLLPEVTLSGENDRLVFNFGEPGKPEHKTLIVPRRTEEDKRPVIGISPPLSTSLFSVKVKREREHPVLFNSPASKAEPPFEFGDQIVATSDPDEPTKIKPLRIDPRDPEKKRPDYFEFRERLVRLAGKPMTIQVRRADGATADIKVPPAFQYTTGLRMKMGRVVAIRQTAPDQKSAVQYKDQVLDAQGTKAEGDVIDSVEVSEPDGGRTRWVVTPNATIKNVPNVTEKVLDPARFPDELNHWADRMTAAKQSAPWKVKMTVKRKVLHEEEKLVDLPEMTWDNSFRYDNAPPRGYSSPIALDGLGLAYVIDTVVEDVAANSPAAKTQTLDGKDYPIQKGDVIEEIRFYEMTKEGEPATPTRKWVKLKANQFAWVPMTLQAVESKNIELKVKRGDTTMEVLLQGAADETWPATDRGMALESERYLQKADNIFHAMELGFTKTRRFIGQIYMMLKSLVTGRLSAELMAGPIEIFSRGQDLLEYDVWTFVLYLGMISVNLAVVNFLPIPVLDGGHFVFLLYEGIRGKQAPEKVMNGANWIGLVLILMLMMFVVVMDLRRTSWWPFG